MNQHIKTISIISISFLIVSCGVDNSDSCTSQQDTTVQQKSDNGLILEPSIGAYIKFDKIQEAYEQTQACMGMTAVGPTIVYKDFSANNIGSGWAFYNPTGKLIWVNNNMNEYQGFKRDCRTDTEALKHEFVHHILHQNGAADESKAHTSVFFKQCGIGVNTYN